eukprot:1156663-Pelagomonas_calceolata.AAC.1
MDWLMDTIEMRSIILCLMPLVTTDCGRLRSVAIEIATARTGYITHWDALHHPAFDAHGHGGSGGGAGATGAHQPQPHHQAINLHKLSIATICHQ